MLTNTTLAAVVDSMPEVELPDFNLGTVGLVLVTAGLVAAFFTVLRDWEKRKGFRMILKDRNDKIHAMWLEIIQNGVDDRIEKGTLSRKEGDEMLAKAAKKLGLYDLVPKKRIAPLVKESLKRDRAKRKLARETGKWEDGTPYVEKSPIPGGPPTPITKPRFSEILGRTAAKFRRNNAA
jgi:hypothetical protein